MHFPHIDNNGHVEYKMSGMTCVYKAVSQYIIKKEHMIAVVFYL